MKDKVESDYDKRVVSYEKVHGIQQKDAKALIDIVDPKNGEIILDAMCGYGAAGKDIIERASGLILYLLDVSEVQLKRAMENLPQLPKDRFIKDSILDTRFQNNFFDKIVIKSGTQEIPKDEKILLAKEVYRILKPKGRLYVWGGGMDDTLRNPIQLMTTKKNELAGLRGLAEKRYIESKSEFLDTYTKAGFKDIRVAHRFFWNISHKNLLTSDFKGDVSKLNELNDFVGRIFSDEQKKQLHYKEVNGDIQYLWPNQIWVLEK